ncbi:ribonuclease 8-like [Trichosurus vulpecula]|uniref:ribonuclease 8-like n=1 Tax=Trichosurus vulpecula TaxID=9337 RepID=UPI00186B50A9|nr:ribonuclease 8-like [Trichosurus vulpecula]
MFSVTEGIPPGFTPAQWFNLQHVQYPKMKASSDNAYCDRRMRRINKHLPLCKSFNSFLDYPLNRVIRVCFQRNANCSNPTYTNCHNSTTAVTVTQCRLTGGTYPTCSYSGRAKQAYFVVACRRPLRADHSTSPLLPTHLDRT